MLFSSVKFGSGTTWGADVFSSVSTKKVRIGKSFAQVAQEIHLDWKLIGLMDDSSLCNVSFLKSICLISEEEIGTADVFKKFLELDKIPEKAFFTVQKQECENYFIKTYFRKNDGRYHLRHTFKENPNKISKIIIALLILTLRFVKFKFWRFFKFKLWRFFRVKLWRLFEFESDLTFKNIRIFMNAMFRMFKISSFMRY